MFYVLSHVPHVFSEPWGMLKLLNMLNLHAALRCNFGGAACSDRESRGVLISQQDVTGKEELQRAWPCSLQQ